MTAKFTKGPWGYDSAHGVVFGGDCLNVLICDMMPTGDAEHDANAQLVQCSTEMYEMLEQVGNLVDMDGMEAIQWIIDNCHDVKSLLAKARGEA
jgi:hypothetical protein